MERVEKFISKHDRIHSKLIKYIPNSDIDIKKWDDCVSTALNTSIYASSWYLNLVSDQWDALILNDYEAVMPLPYKRKWGLKYIHQPYFCQQLGVFTKTENYSVEAFLNAIPKFFLRVTVNLNVHNGYSKYSFKKNTNYELLLKPVELLRKNYSKSHSKNIRRAHKHQVVISQTTDLPLAYFKKKAKESKYFLSKKAMALEQKIISHALENNKGQLYSASFEGRNCCSVFLLEHQKRIILLSSYSNTIGKNKSAYFFLLDYIFSLEKYQGYTFDFEGSTLVGVAEVNKGFGATNLTYYTVRLNFWDRFRFI